VPEPCSGGIEPQAKEINTPKTILIRTNAIPRLKNAARKASDDLSRNTTGDTGDHSITAY
jgi:hypothetical protein